MEATRRGFLCQIAGPLLKIPEYRRAGMVYRKLGRTGIDVSLLAFGSHTDPAYKRPGPIRTVLTEEGQSRRDRQIAKAFDRGVNILDVYESEGQWEPAARLVKSRRDRIVVSTSNNNPEPMGRNVDRAARLFGHCDLYRFHTAEIDGVALENWDVLRKAKAAGKVRAIGIATHVEPTLLAALQELEGLDFLFFPYNFIHARADYGQFLDKAVAQGVGLIAMKPLAAGSLVNLDPRARTGARPEEEKVALWQSGHKTVLPAAVAELTKALGRRPDETLCMAAMRFVYAHQFVACAMTGMFDEQWVDDNYAALQNYQQTSPETLQAARQVAALLGPQWLPSGYRWLEERWHAR